MQGTYFTSQHLEVQGGGGGIIMRRKVMYLVAQTLWPVQALNLNVCVCIVCAKHFACNFCIFVACNLTVWGKVNVSKLWIKFLSWNQWIKKKLQTNRGTFSVTPCSSQTWLFICIGKEEGGNMCISTPPLPPPSLSKPYSFVSGKMLSSLTLNC